MVQRSLSKGDYRSAECGDVGAFDPAEQPWPVPGPGGEQRWCKMQACKPTGVPTVLPDIEFLQSSQNAPVTSAQLIPKLSNV
jgi:hypothetical protein